MAYRILAWFLRIVTRVFFRQVEVVGLENIPPGPVLFAGNHPNSLIDPILIITTCGRKVHFAAKDTLFKGRRVYRLGAKESGTGVLLDFGNTGTATFTAAA